MSAHVVVIAADLRRATVKVSPGTYLVDVLEQGCTKLRLASDKYILKHKQKQVDLSVPFRTSGLMPGAKLELVQKANTPSVVQVALQLPGDAGRLVRKFPADLTLWKMLRQFESGDDKKLNLTARAVARGGKDETGGQLYYETPVLNLMGRELASLTDLQKTLSQLGHNSGNVLARLAFRATDMTLVDALQQMTNFFDEVEEKEGERQQGSKATEQPHETTKSEQPRETSPDNTPQDAAPEQRQDTATTDTCPSPPPSSSSSPSAPAENKASHDQTLATERTTEVAPQDSSPSEDAYRPVAVFLAPTGSTPAAALRPADEDDFTPTVAHAQLHQARLQESSRNKRLLSDKEVADRVAADEARIAAVQSLLVRVRFPDNTSGDWRLGPHHSAAFLYQAVRRVMANRDGPFRLVLPGGKTVIRDADGSADGLVRAYRLSGRVLVNLVWDDAVTNEARKQPFLRPDIVAERAEALHVPEPPPVADESKTTVPVVQPAADKDGGEKRDGGGGKKIPKWLKLGKK